MNYLDSSFTAQSSPSPRMKLGTGGDFEGSYRGANRRSVCDPQIIRSLDLRRPVFGYIDADRSERSASIGIE